MVTKREYLVGLGKARPGRGRLSNEAREALNAAINKGVKFDEPDTAPKSVTVKTKTDDGKTIVVTKRTNDVPQVADPRPDRPQGMYVFQNPDGSTFERLHTVACFRCSMSLRWCYCVDGPSLLAYPHQTGAEYATLVKVPKAVTTAAVAPPKPTTRARRGSGTRRRR